MTSSKVYVVQNHAQYNEKTGLMEPKFNMSHAESWGELVYLIPPMTPPKNLGKIISKIQDKLGDFSDNDVLLLTGNPIFIGICTALAASNNEGRVRFLQWSSKDKKYYEKSAKGL